MTKDEALDMALEFVEANHSGVPDAFELIAAIKQSRSAPPTHKTARWTDEEYREISDQVISTLVEYGAELRTADCQMQILREELAESRREVAQLKAQRQWVGLTDEDFENAFQETYIMGDSDLQDFAKVIEAKLKERNHG
jgi:hypothetical protein